MIGRWLKLYVGSCTRDLAISGAMPCPWTLATVLGSCCMVALVRWLGDFAPCFVFVITSQELLRILLPTQSTDTSIDPTALAMKIYVFMFTYYVCVNPLSGTYWEVWTSSSQRHLCVC